MTITASSVLWGICNPVCKLRHPITLEDEQTLTLPQVNRACQIFFDIEETRRSLSKSGVIRTIVEGYRVRLLFPYDNLSADEAANWGKIFNAHLAGYRIIMIPHYDAGLKLDFDVIPDEGFRLGFVADKYIGHNGTFTFIGRHLLASIPLRTSAVGFSPRVHG